LFKSAIIYTAIMSAKKGKKKVTLGYRMIEMLGKKFDELDKDKSGSLTLDELFALSDTGAADAEKIMEHFDMNGDQEIEREEFKHVGLILLSNQKFREVDTDGNGTLDPHEFKAALLQLNYEPEQIDKLFKRADADKNGVVDRFEFLSALLHMITDNDSDFNLGAAWAQQKVEDSTQGLQVALEPHFGPLPEGMEPGTKVLRLEDVGEILVNSSNLVNIKIPLKVRVEEKDEIKLIPMELSLPLKISTDLMQDAVTQQWKKVYKMLLD